MVTQILNNPRVWGPNDMTELFVSARRERG